MSVEAACTKAGQLNSRWKKTLYQTNRDLPDNYVPPDFLQQYDNVSGIQSMFTSVFRNFQRIFKP
jgi:hypothetical protein